jgi:sigma-B regulation protein RsbU (phosphoserine phosphatase)
VTDGVTEAMNPRRELYGASRLRSVLERHRGDSPQALVAAVGEDVRAFAGGADQSDDVTLLCVRWNGDAAAGLAPSGEEDVEEDLSIGLALPTGR